MPTTTDRAGMASREVVTSACVGRAATSSTRTSVATRAPARAAAAARRASRRSLSTMRGEIGPGIVAQLGAAGGINHGRANPAQSHVSGKDKPAKCLFADEAGTPDRKSDLVAHSAPPQDIRPWQ